MKISDPFMAAIIDTFEANERLADRAIEQIPDDLDVKEKGAGVNPSRLLLSLQTI